LCFFIAARNRKEAQKNVTRASGRKFKIDRAERVMFGDRNTRGIRGIKGVKIVVKGKMLGKANIHCFRASHTID
jgi:hypothetical protein